MWTWWAPWPGDGSLSWTMLRTLADVPCAATASKPLWTCTHRFCRLRSFYGVRHSHRLRQRHRWRSFLSFLIIRFGLPHPESEPAYLLSDNIYYVYYICTHSHLRHGLMTNVEKAATESSVTTTAGLQPSSRRAKFRCSQVRAVAWCGKRRSHARKRWLCGGSRRNGAQAWA